jgi:hypothetical protein
MGTTTPGQNQGTFVVCVKAKDYPASLELQKVYRVKPDPEALERGLLRVFDESGEDYLYPEECFRAR